MPSAEPNSVAVSRRDDALVFDGVLTRPVVASAWPRAQALLRGAQRMDLTAVSRIDSAGLAMLVALAREGGIRQFDGAPAGYAELRAAYRLDDALAFAAG